MAVKVKVGIITSSDLDNPIDSSAKCSPDVAEFTDKAFCSPPMYSVKRSSNSLTFGPEVSQPESKTSLIELIV